MSSNFTSKKRSFEELGTIANDIRKSIITMLETAGSGHSAGPLGLADILTVLYFDVMQHDPKHPDWEKRDILLLSNGHCVPVQYATMARAGYFPEKELMTLRKFKSRLQGHPERTKLPGLENTSGPLGCGLSQACGMALGLRLRKEFHRRVYVITGDGELDEGNNWEAIMFAAKYKLNNIIAIVDRNNIQIDGPTESIMPLENLRKKWESFGWYVIEAVGNSIPSIISACAMARAIQNMPVVIIAHTIPGKGVDFMENDFKWHGKPPNHEEAVIALKELRSLRGKIRGEHE